ncbi:MAG: hypothetical protein IKF80_04120 [Erysipelotrichaceae bacterium]|nr:hypothetical protein [Erysipelotrichaceae bacterium]
MEISKEKEDAISLVIKTIKKSKGQKAEATPEEISEFIEDAIDIKLKPYIASSGEFNFEPCLIRILDPCREQMQGVSVEDETRYGFVIEPCMMFGRDYFAVLSEGSLMKVPADNVTFLDKEENQ